MEEQERAENNRNGQLWTGKGKEGQKRTKKGKEGRKGLVVGSFPLERIFILGPNTFFIFYN